MIRSMTGFGRSSAAAGERWFISVTTKSVNHRFLETSVRLPEALWELEQSVRNSVSEIFSRGKVDVTVRAQRIDTPDYDVRINRKVADAVVPQLQSIATELGGSSAFQIADLLRVPDLVEVQPRDRELTDEEKSSITSIVRSALEEMRGTREREGEALKADVAARIATIGAHRAELETLRPLVQEEALTSYRERVQELARVAGVEVPEERLAQETVLLVEKGDIAEELTRLAIHLKEASTLLTSKEPAGKKLDFLSQEMLREINTMGSKSRSAKMRSLVVELKAEVERIREQVQNVE